MSICRSHSRNMIQEYELFYKDENVSYLAFIICIYCAFSFLSSGSCLPHFLRLVKGRIWEDYVNQVWIFFQGQWYFRFSCCLFQGQRIPDLFRFQALITTYEIIIADVELLSSIEWRCAIIDEAHRLKNKNCRLLEGLRLFDLVCCDSFRCWLGFVCGSVTDSISPLAQKQDVIEGLF